MNPYIHMHLNRPKRPQATHHQGQPPSRKRRRFPPPLLILGILIPLATAAYTNRETIAVAVCSFAENPAKITQCLEWLTQYD